MSSRKKIPLSCKILIFIVCGFALEKLCYQATAGFQISRILTPKGVTAFEEEIVNPPMPPALRSKLQQPFRFLGSGSQSYAFISEDGQYILKVFKQHHFIIPSFLKKIPLPKLVRMPCDNLVDFQEKKREQFIKSCVIASHELKEETGTLYAHLAPSTELGFSLTVIDKLNIAHTLSADQLQFVVQRKADLVIPTLRKLTQEGRIEEAKECIHSLISLIQTRSRKGIGDRDPVIRRNFGFIQGQAVEIDIGSYYQNPFLKVEPLHTRAVYFELKNLHSWLDCHFPMLAAEVSLILFEGEGPFRRIE